MGVVNSVVKTVESAFKGVEDIFSGNISQGLGELVPAAVTAGTMYLTGGMGGGLESMLAEDAAALTAQGLAEDQVASTLATQYGVDAFVASDAASLASSGLGADQIASTLTSSYGTTPEISNLATQIGDQAGDFPTTGGFGSPTAPGVQEAAKVLMDTNATTAAGGSALQTLKDLAGYAKTGSQLIGGVNTILGGNKLMGGTGVKPGAADPYAAYRPANAAQLNELLQNPSTITSDPQYKFLLSQGLQGLQAQQAAQGRLVSGGALLQGQQFGQQLAQSSYADKVKTLAQLSGASQAPATGAYYGSNIGTNNTFSTLAGMNTIAQGIGQVSNPLATLYSMYNSGTPTVTG